jgi:hypothetical protein
MELKPGFLHGAIRHVVGPALIWSKVTGSEVIRGALK